MDGSGWKLAETIVDELGRQLPVYAKGNVDTVAQLGLLAANQVAAAGGGYSSRSTLATFSKVTNLYFGDVKVINPSKDTIKVSSNSENIVNLGKLNPLEIVFNRFWPIHFWKHTMPTTGMELA